MSEPRATTRDFHERMSVVAAEITKFLNGWHHNIVHVAAENVYRILEKGRLDDLTKEQVALTGLISIFSFIRVEKLNEEAILLDAQRRAVFLEVYAGDHNKKTATVTRGLVGVLDYISNESLHEKDLVQTARRALPTVRAVEQIIVKKES